MVTTYEGFRIMLRRRYPSITAVRAPQHRDVLVLDGSLSGSDIKTYRQRRIAVDNETYYIVAIPYHVKGRMCGIDNESYESVVQDIVTNPAGVLYRIHTAAAYRNAPNTPGQALGGKTLGGHLSGLMRGQRPAWQRSHTFQAIEALNDYVTAQVQKRATQGIIDMRCGTPANTPLHTLLDTYKGYESNIPNMDPVLQSTDTPKVCVEYITTVPIHDLELLARTPYIYRQLQEGEKWYSLQKRAEMDVTNCYYTLLIIGNMKVTDKTDSVLPVLDTLSRAVLKGVLRKDMSWEEVIKLDLRDSYGHLVKYQRLGLISDEVQGDIRPLLGLMIELWEEGATMSSILSAVREYEENDSLIDLIAMANAHALTPPTPPTDCVKDDVTNRVNTDYFESQTIDF